MGDVCEPQTASLGSARETPTTPKHDFCLKEA